MRTLVLVLSPVSSLSAALCPCPVTNLLGRALVHPDRIKRDEALAADSRKRADEQAAASLKASQDAPTPEEAPAPPPRPYNPTQLTGGDSIP